MAKKTSRFICKKEKKVQVSDPNGLAFVKATFNNVIVTITDGNGNVLSWSRLEKKDLKAQERIHLMLLK